MTRYIDEKDVYALVEPRGTARVHCSQIDELQRADVVPRSEVERWRRNLEAVLEERAETKQEVAREIFEEIERETKNHGITYTQRKIAELKKKYTED